MLPGPPITHNPNCLSNWRWTVICWRSISPDHFLNFPRISAVCGRSQLFSSLIHAYTQLWRRRPQKKFCWFVVGHPFWFLFFSTQAGRRPKDSKTEVIKSATGGGSMNRCSWTRQKSHRRTHPTTTASPRKPPFLHRHAGLGLCFSIAPPPPYPCSRHSPFHRFLFSQWEVSHDSQFTSSSESRVGSVPRKLV